MQRDINPYLEEPKTDKSLCTWMFNSMPSEHFWLLHPKKVEAAKESWDDDPTKVQEALMEIAAVIHVQMLKSGATGVGLYPFVPQGVSPGGAPG